MHFSLHHITNKWKNVFACQRWKEIVTRFIVELYSGFSVTAVDSFNHHLIVGSWISSDDDIRQAFRLMSFGLTWTLSPYWLQSSDQRKPTQHNLAVLSFFIFSTDTQFMCWYRHTRNRYGEADVWCSARLWAALFFQTLCVLHDNSKEAQDQYTPHAI